MGLFFKHLLVIVAVCLVAGVLSDSSDSSDSSENCKLICSAYLLSTGDCTRVAVCGGLCAGALVLDDDVTAFTFPIDLIGSAQQEFRTYNACIRFPSSPIYKNGVKLRMPYLVEASAALPLRLTWYYSNDISKSYSQEVDVDSESESGEGGDSESESGEGSGVFEGTLPPSDEDNALCIRIDTVNAVTATENIANVISFATFAIEYEDECEE